MCCTLSKEVIDKINNPFIGCDGNPHSNEFLLKLEMDAVKKNNFKLAIMYRDELIRRNEETYR